MPNNLYAEIQRRGRIWWQVKLIRDGETWWDSRRVEDIWSVPGEKWARSKARRAVAKAKRRPNYQAQKFRINPSEDANV